MPPNFYNAGDQAIYSAGDFFIPQERYRAAPYTVNQPTNPDEVPAGIPTVYRPQGNGGLVEHYKLVISDLTMTFFANSKRFDKIAYAELDIILLQMETYLILVPTGNETMMEKLAPMGFPEDLSYSNN